jgi:hypothetical protein
MTNSVKEQKKQAVLTKSSPNLLTHSDLFTIFVPTLAKAASFGVGGPSSEASLLTVVLSLFFGSFTYLPHDNNDDICNY